MNFSFPPKKAGRFALVCIFLVVLLDIIGLGIIIPVLPSLLTSLTGRPVSEVALLGGALLFVYALAQFIMSPILGGLSDRFGRRPVVLFSLIGYSADFLLMAVAPTYAWLFVGRMLSGAFAATYSTANAIIADVSPPEKRSANFGLIGAAFGLGFITGPVIGGTLGDIDVRLPFFVASGLIFLNFLFAFFVLPETIRDENRRPFDIRRANPLGSLMKVSTYPIVLGVLFTFFLMQFAHHSLPSIWSYFTAEKYGWSESDIGWSLGFVGVLAAIVQGYAARKLIPILGERRSVWIGMGAMVVEFIGFALLSPTGIWLFAWMIAGAVGGFMMPAMQGLMSRATPDNAQGELQGAISSVMSLTMLASPLLMTWTFKHFTVEGTPVYFPGAPFILAAIILAMAAIPFTITMNRAHLRAKTDQAAMQTTLTEDQEAE